MEMGENEEEEFELSLRMQPSTPRAKDRTDAGHMPSPVPQLKSQPSPDAYCNSYHSNTRSVELEKKCILTAPVDSTSRSHSFSEGLSRSPEQSRAAIARNNKNTVHTEPFKYSVNLSNVTLSSLQRDLPRHDHGRLAPDTGRPRSMANGHDSHNNNLPAERPTAMPLRPVSVCSTPMRRWESDHGSPHTPTQPLWPNSECFSMCGDLYATFTLY